MRFADLESIWASDLSSLSNADKGRVYFERAKQVVTEALADPKKRAQAVSGKRFLRTYLIEKIGCQPAVPQQNTKIRSLLADTDAALGREATSASSNRPMPGSQTPEVTELRATIDALRRRVEVINTENVELRRKLRMAGWVEMDLPDHGHLPW
jgi:hypothetical protein